MSNYTNENLINVPSSNVPAGTLAMKVGDNIFTAGNVTINQGSSMDFYKCASVSGADYYTVSGAGDSGESPVNGNYTDSGQSANGKPVYSYTNNGTTYYLFFWGSEYDGDYWCIKTSLDISYYPPEEALYYKSGGDSPDGGTWYANEYSEGLGDAPTVTLTHAAQDVPRTWTGYKAVFNSSRGMYTREMVASSGLAWSAKQPHIGGIYTDGVLLDIASVYGWGLPEWPDFDHNFKWVSYGTTTEDIVDGIQCMMLDANGYIGCPDPVLVNPGAFTLSSWHKKKTNTYTFLSISGGNYGHGSGNELQIISSQDHVTVTNGATYEDSVIYSGSPTANWVNIIVAWTGTNVKVWINGQPVQVQYDTDFSFSSSSLYLYINSLRRATEIRGNGYYAGVKVYNRVISDAQAAAIYAEYVPSAS